MKWEYNWQRPGFVDPEETEKLGQDGWEWAGMLGDDWVIFKRPAEPEPPALLVVNNVNGMETRQLIDTIKAELDRYWVAQAEAAKAAKAASTKRAVR